MNNRRVTLAVVLILLLLASGIGYRLLTRTLEPVPPAPSKTTDRGSEPGNATVAPAPGSAQEERTAASPMLIEIEPGDGAIVSGTETWVRWPAAPSDSGRVRWRKVGETDFRIADAKGNDAMLARLDGLAAGSTYEYEVESRHDGRARRSGLRHFMVESGIAIETGGAYTVQRDYDQIVSLKFRNDSGKKLVVAARALARFGDLPAGMVGRGSADEPVELSPGKTLDLRFSVTAVDATREEYDIPIATAGAAAVLKIRVAPPEFKLVMRVVAEDPRTLAKTIEVRNEGATLADLAVAIAPPNQRDVRLDPTAGHAYLPAGATLQIQATPVLYLEFTSLKAELVCSAGGKESRFALEYRAPADKRLIGVRSGTTQTTSGGDWYCTNKPSTCGDIPGPNGSGPQNADPSLMARLPLQKQFLSTFIFAAGPPKGLSSAKPKPSSCAETTKCAQPYIDRAKARWDLLNQIQSEKLNLVDESPQQYEQDIEYWNKMYDDVLNAYNEIRAECLKKCGFDIGAYNPHIQTGPNTPSCPPPTPVPVWSKSQKDNAAILSSQYRAQANQARTENASANTVQFYQFLADFYMTRAKDPPDAAFAEVFEPVVEPIAARGEATHAERLDASLNEARAWHLAYLKACLKSFERYQGADAAKDARAMVKQAEAMNRFAESAMQAGRRARRLELAVERPKLAALGKVTASIKARIDWIDRLPADLDGGKVDVRAEPRDVSFLVGEQILAMKLLDAAQAARGIPDLSTDPDKENSAPLRQGLEEALQRRATFTRVHRGAFAAPIQGDSSNSSDLAAGWHADDRVCFAWHQDGDIIFTALDPAGQTLTPPTIIGRGRWPRLAADGKRIAVVWTRGDNSVVRFQEEGKWRNEIELPGREASLAFAPGGPLFAATSKGLWKLSAAAFERIHEASYSQPSLVVDTSGKPHAAERKDGKIVYDDIVVDDGDRPTLAAATDGVIHLAYRTKDGVAWRQRQAAGWTNARIIQARKPSWPTLARDGDGVRLTYIGAAERGPDALWLVRAQDSKPILMPSLAGNITEANLMLEFGLRYGRWNYRPHDLWIFVNDVRVAAFHDVIPEGRYLFPLDPAQIFTSAGAPAVNRVSLRSWHMNGGHYATNSNYQLIVRTAWSEWFAFAADEAEVLKAAAGPSVNHDQPDLTVLANSLNLPVQAPASGFVEFPVTIANLGENSSKPARLVMLDGDKTLAKVDLEPVKPGQQTVVRMRLDGRLESALFKIEQDQPDFNPANDSLLLHLWSKSDAAEGQPARAIAVRETVDVTPAWLAGSLPDGAKLIGDWNWLDEPAHSSTRSHAGSPGDGPSLHYFIHAKTPLILKPGEDLIQYVYLDPQAHPREIVLQLYTESAQKEQRVYWGESLIDLGQPGFRVGPLPETGRWVRLSVPVERFGLREARVTGILFGHFDGRAFWGPTTKDVGEQTQPPVGGGGIGVRRN